MINQMITTKMKMVALLK